MLLIQNLQLDILLCPLLLNIVAFSHMWLLSIWNVTSDNWHEKQVKNTQQRAETYCLKKSTIVTTKLIE